MDMPIINPSKQPDKIYKNKQDVKPDMLKHQGGKKNLKSY